MIDLQWVRDLTVPLPLSLTDRPFVPHNLISAQQSPVPVPKFQMAPRLKIIMSSGSKKGTQIYYPFHSKVPASESPPGSPTGPLWREIPAYRAFITVLLIYTFYLSPRVPGKGAPSMLPNRVPMDRDTPSPEPLVYLFIHSCMSVGVPNKEPSYIHTGKT